MISNPTPEQIADLWWTSKDTGKTMTVLATSSTGEEIGGDVIGRGSMMRVKDPDDGRTWEDVRPEWVWMTSLIEPRNNEGKDA